MERLDCGDNPLSDLGTQALANNLKYLTQLKQLSFNEIHFGSHAAKSLARNLHWVKGLEQLNLSRNSFDLELATHLQELSMLARLDLSFRSIDSGLAEALALSLAPLSQLSSLDLRSNELKKSGAEALLRVLPQLKDLEKLYLGENEIPELKTRIRRLPIVGRFRLVFYPDDLF